MNSPFKIDEISTNFPRRVLTSNRCQIDADACIGIWFLVLITATLLKTLLTDYKWCIAFVVWLTDKKHLNLFPAATIVIDPHDFESPRRREHDLKLHRTWVQALLNKVMQYYCITVPHGRDVPCIPLLFHDSKFMTVFKEKKMK